MDGIIEIKVNGSHLTKDNRYAGVRGEANVKQLRIEFDEGWDGYAKKVTFWDALMGNPVERTLTTDLLEDITLSTRIYLVAIPGEAMTEAGEMTFVIDGYIEGKRKRSVSDTLIVEDAPVADHAGEPADPTPSQAEQLQAEIESIKEDIQKAATAAAGAEVAVKSAEEAARSAQAAGSSEAAAKAAQTAAEKARDEAKEIAGGDFATRTEAREYANTAEKNAKTYAAEQDAEVLKSAKKYTDDKGPVYIEATMMASGWTGNTYSFEAEYPHDQYNIEVSVAGTATAEQFEAAGAAMIGGSATSNVYTALGEVPTVDIPVIVEVVKK